MGWGQADAHLIYGFNVGDRDHLLDPKYSYGKCRGIKCFADEFFKGCFGEAFYGIECCLNRKTGQPQISKEKKRAMRMLFNTYMAHLKANLSPSAYELKVKGNHIQEGIKLGYYVVVSGEPLWNSNLHHKIVNMADIKEVEESNDDGDDGAEEDSDIDDDEEKKDDNEAEEENDDEEEIDDAEAEEENETVKRTSKKRKIT